MWCLLAWPLRVAVSDQSLEEVDFALDHALAV